MNSDRKLFKWLGLLILAPILLAVFGGDRFRYPCQDPANWDSAECQKPRCEVTRTCPEHIFKGGEGDQTQSAASAVMKPVEQGCKK
jgi:hypothetical protein